MNFQLMCWCHEVLAWFTLFLYCWSPERLYFQLVLKSSHHGDSTVPTLWSLIGSFLWLGSADLWRVFLNREDQTLVTRRKMLMSRLVQLIFFFFFVQFLLCFFFQLFHLFLMPSRGNRQERIFPSKHFFWTWGSVRGTISKISQGKRKFYWISI